MRIFQTGGPSFISRKETSHCPLHSKDITHDNPGDSVLHSNTEGKATFRRQILPLPPAVTRFIRTRKWLLGIPSFLTTS